MSGAQLFLVLVLRIRECVEEAPRLWSMVVKCHPDLFRGEGKVSPNTVQGRGLALSLGECLESWRGWRQQGNGGEVRQSESGGAFPGVAGERTKNTP